VAKKPSKAFPGISENGWEKLDAKGLLRHFSKCLQKPVIKAYSECPIPLLEALCEVPLKLLKAFS
jgi:hypothetical protein